MGQELAETGSVQPPKEVWGDLREMHRAMGKTGATRVSTSMDFEALESTPFGVLLPVAKAVIQISEGCNSGWDEVRRMEYTMGSHESDMHLDPETMKGGFGIFFVKRPLPKECLVTAGRSIRANYQAKKIFRYENGPVIVAQNGFGNRLINPPLVAGPTWHTGRRDRASRFGVLDFFPPNDTRQA